MTDKKSKVALAKSENVQENVTRVFDLLGGVSNMIEKGSTVVLKPNAGHAAPAEYAVCTNPETVRAVIREVKKAEPKSIVIAESAAIGCDTMECYEACGIKDMAEEEGIELIDIKSEKDLVNVAVRGYRSNIKSCKIPRFLLEADHIINLPILKAHASMVFSCALKNIKGVVQDAVHFQMHAQNLTMAMMDVWYAARADINIVDAMYAASGFSPHTPTPLKLDCVLGSYDPVAVDRVACDLVGINTDEVDYFKVAAEVGMGHSQPDEIELVGDKLEDCYKKMWVPYLGDISERWPEYDVHCKGACSSCQAMMTLNMETLKAIGEYDKLSDFTVVIGHDNDDIPKDKDPQKLLLHGNCTKKYLKDHPDALWVPGCPPGETGMYMAMSRGEVIDPDKDPNIVRDYVRPRLDKDMPAWRAYVDKKAAEFYGTDK